MFKDDFFTLFLAHRKLITGKKWFSFFRKTYSGKTGALWHPAGLEVSEKNSFSTIIPEANPMIVIINFYFSCSLNFEFKAQY